MMNSLFFKTACRKVVLSALLLTPMASHGDMSSFPATPFVCQVCGTDADLVTYQALQFIANIMSSDITRNQLATALINYDAAARINEYQINLELLLMAAPGSAWAIQTGQNIGVYMAVNSTTGISPYANTALSVSNSTMVNTYGLFTSAKSLTMNGQSYDLTNGPLVPTSLYSSLQSFVTGGDTTNLGVFNAAALMQNDNLTTANISATQAQQMITLLTNPFPNIDPTLQANIQNAATTPLDGQDQESVATLLAESAVLSLSTSALGDIVARRTPSGTGSPSVMQIMDQYAQQRFTNPDWYKDMSGASEPAIIREMTHMMAYNSWVQYQQFRLQEQQMALMASLNAVMSKMNASLQQLSSQIAVSTAQGQSQAQQIELQLQQQQQQQQSQ